LEAPHEAAATAGSFPILDVEPVRIAVDIAEKATPSAVCPASDSTHPFGEATPPSTSWATTPTARLHADEPKGSRMIDEQGTASRLRGVDDQCGTVPDVAVLSRARTRVGADTILVAQLGAGMTQAQAAEMAGVSVDTVQRRLADPMFRAQLERFRRDILDRTAFAIVSSTTAAIDALRAVIESPESKGAEVVQAARVLLDNAVRFEEQTGLRSRIRALEGQANISSKDKR
jgi:hypothetical protein